VALEMARPNLQANNQICLSRGCTGKMGQIFFALESYENWGSYQDSAQKESSKISGKKMTEKSPFGGKNT
jgi:hypothetical protein